MGMKRWKKKEILSVLLGSMLAACLLSACTKEVNDEGRNVNETGTQQDTDDSKMRQDSVRADVEQPVAEVDMKQEWKDLSAPEEEEKSLEARSLSKEELSEFTKFVTEADGYGNYGFLLSVYDSPEKIDLEEVFYTGAGIKTEPLSREEEKAYLNAAGYEEIYTDVVKLTTAKMNEVLLRRTGLSYEQMENPLQWTYLPEYDAYYHEAGDTNYTAYTCIGGTTKDEKRFTLRFKRDENLMEGAYRQIDTETVLEKTEEGYRFISNRLMTEEGLIKDQTFQTTVAQHGEVTVAAYEPETEKNPAADVTFIVLKDGQAVAYLWGMEQENIRNALFHRVECVSFPDYNRDGYTDMIAICSYFSGTDPNAGEEFMEARIYSGNEWGYFALEEDLSRTTNSALTEIRIESVLDFLGYDR